jgi:hypothetical protein
MDRTDRTLGGILVLLLAAFVIQAAFFGGTGAGALVADSGFGGASEKASAPITGPLKRPDLVPVFISSRLDGSNTFPLKAEIVQVPVGSTVFLVEQLTNNGTAVAESSYSRIVSQDGSKADFRPSLEAGHHLNTEIKFECVVPGIFYFSSRADFDHRVIESDEANNGAFAAITCE